VIYCKPCDPDPTDERETEGELTAEVNGEVLAALNLVGEGVPVIAELREDDDDAQLEVAKMLVKWRSRIRPAVMGRGGRRLVPWPCCRERGQSQRMQREGKGGDHTQRFRSSRRP
jgi:hypothetical protein